MEVLVALDLLVCTVVLTGGHEGVGDVVVRVLDGVDLQLALCRLLWWRRERKAG